MGLALSWRETLRQLTLDPNPGRATDEPRLVSNAYLAWPIALYEQIAPREDASSWYRFHMRQAFWFGVISSAIGALALLWPLLASFIIPNVGVTIWIYAVAMLIDVALFLVWLVLALRYARRAGHGDLFDVPWVTRLTGATSSKR